MKMSKDELQSAVRGQSLQEIQECSQRLQEQRGVKEGEQGRRGGTEGRRRKGGSATSFLI